MAESAAHADLGALIEELRRRHRTWLRELPEAEEVEVRWSVTAHVLRYHVVLEDVIEPDVDLEITSEAVVVRARPQHHRERLFLGVLPVPPHFDPAHPLIRFESGYLEVALVEEENQGSTE